jgi:putative ABC transport system permease protein
VNGAWLLGWRYLRWHRLKTTILVCAVTLMMFLPAATRLLVDDSAAALTARADTTPIIAGAAGSPLELVLNSLYFHAAKPPQFPFSIYRELAATGLAPVIPLNTRFNTRGAPIVGTSLEYFAFRDLKLAQGRMMGMLGECVIGADIAKRFGAGLGDSLVSSPETVFDIAGVYPLKMTITGILQPAGNADDGAVFVDYRTSWVIEGLGHGHQDLAGAGAVASVLSRNESSITANAALVQYSEITPENVAEFHFHGNTDDFPLSGALLFPPDEKNTALLRGRYLDDERAIQVVVPAGVLDTLLATVFTVQDYVVIGLLTLIAATIAVITLVFLLSQQLRRGEFHTLSRIGASRMYIAALVASEIGFVLVSSLVFASALTLLVRHYALQIFQALLSF